MWKIISHQFVNWRKYEIMLYFVTKRHGHPNWLFPLFSRAHVWLVLMTSKPDSWTRSPEVHHHFRRSVGDTLMTSHISVCACSSGDVLIANHGRLTPQHVLALTVVPGVYIGEACLMAASFTVVKLRELVVVRSMSSTPGLQPLFL